MDWNYSTRWGISHKVVLEWERQLLRCLWIRIHTDWGRKIVQHSCHCWIKTNYSISTNFLGKQEMNFLEQPADHVAPFLLCPVRFTQQLRGKFRIMLPEQKQQGKPFQTGQRISFPFWRGDSWAIRGYLWVKVNSWTTACLGTFFLYLPNTLCVDRCLFCIHKADKRPIHERLNNLNDWSHSSGPWACGRGYFSALSKMSLALIESQTQFKSRENLFLLNDL